VGKGFFDSISLSRSSIGQEGLVFLIFFFVTLYESIFTVDFIMFRDGLLDGWSAFSYCSLLDMMRLVAYYCHNIRNPVKHFFQTRNAARVWDWNWREHLWWITNSSSATTHKLAISFLLLNETSSSLDVRLYIQVELDFPSLSLLSFEISGWLDYLELLLMYVLMKLRSSSGTSFFK
jgi:hypothetical protein